MTVSMDAGKALEKNPISIYEQIPCKLGMKSVSTAWSGISTKSLIVLNNEKLDVAS